jgi:hypothetical protein
VKGFQQRLGKVHPDGVLQKGGRVCDNRRNLFVQFGFVPAAENELLTKSVARRVASPSGTPSRIKSLVFM